MWVGACIGIGLAGVKRGIHARKAVHDLCYRSGKVKHHSAIGIVITQCYRGSRAQHRGLVDGYRKDVLIGTVWRSAALCIYIDILCSSDHIAGAKRRTCTPAAGKIVTISQGRQRIAVAYRYICRVVCNRHRNYCYRKGFFVGAGKTTRARYLAYVYRLGVIDNISCYIYCTRAARCSVISLPCWERRQCVPQILANGDIRYRQHIRLRHYYKCKRSEAICRRSIIFLNPYIYRFISTIISSRRSYRRSACIGGSLAIIISNCIFGRVHRTQDNRLLRRQVESCIIIVRGSLTNVHCRRLYRRHITRLSIKFESLNEYASIVVVFYPHVDGLPISS